MKVRELIDALKKMPQELDACIWDEDDQEFVPVQDVLFEEGHSTVDLHALHQGAKVKSQ
jgi:hypothetical protein